ncbi:MAG: sulfatase-like hydrolase/transferase [Kiritimatiellia bacterium]
MKHFIVLAATLFTLAAPAPAADRPNIVVLLSDDAGYHEFSMQGSKTIPTPRIDSIAKSGVYFSNGYVSGCVCSPTRAGLLTGRYQQRFGHEFNIPPVYSETNGLSLDETTLPAVLQPAGYRTIAIGKWHLGYAPKFHPLERGFTDYYGFLQGARSYGPAGASRLNQLLRDRKAGFPRNSTTSTDHPPPRPRSTSRRTRTGCFLYLAFIVTHEAAPGHQGRPWYRRRRGQDRRDDYRGRLGGRRRVDLR